MKHPNFLQERDMTYSKYKRITNMSYSELKKWSQNPCSRKASLDRSPIRINLRLLKKRKEDWNKKDISDANKTISFISRMKNVDSGKEIKGCGLSKRDISLLNWAYNPKK